MDTKERKVHGELPTPSEVRRLLDFDGQVLRWAIRAANCVRVGDAAGTVDYEGYVCLSLHKKRMRAHRVIWAWYWGVWPLGEIDHINGVRADNRIENLREVTATHNHQNQRRAHTDSRTGVLGVVRNKSGTFSSSLSSFGRTVYLGTFATAQAAHASYINKKRELHEGNTL